MHTLAVHRDHHSTPPHDPFPRSAEHPLGGNIPPPGVTFVRSPSYQYFGGVQRDLDGAINEPLITKFRIVFLEVLRKHYHRHVQEGRLPRGSQAALTLLNSIDIGMETVHTDGLQDWDAVRQSLKTIHRATAWNAQLRSFCTDWCRCHESSFILTLLLETQRVRDANRIYILTSFMDAHSYAQEHIPYYLGEEVGISTPEEALIVKESASSVAEARAMLDDLEVDTVSLYTTRQAACIILNATETLIQHFGEEGILSNRDAMHLFEVSEADRKRLVALTSLPRRLAASLTPGRIFAVGSPSSPLELAAAAAGATGATEGYGRHGWGGGGGGGHA